jgi:hypothetical protein
MELIIVDVAMRSGLDGQLMVEIGALENLNHLSDCG